MRNGKSAGISAISMPTSTFSGIDPTLISTGSLAVDRNRNAVWVSVPPFQDKSTEIKVVVKGISPLSLNQALDW
jgi:hypothetical protein